MNDYAFNVNQINGSLEIASASGALVSFEQLTEVYMTGSGAVVSFDQAVKTIGSGAVINIAQVTQAP